MGVATVYECAGQSILFGLLDDVRFGAIESQGVRCV
jgi:hypothetical protein